MILNLMKMNSTFTNTGIYHPRGKGFKYPSVTLYCVNTQPGRCEIRQSSYGLALQDPVPLFSSSVPEHPDCAHVQTPGYSYCIFQNLTLFQSNQYFSNLQPCFRSEQKMWCKSQFIQHIFPASQLKFTKIALFTYFLILFFPIR